MTERLFLLLCILLLCGPANLTAQETEATDPLEVVLEELQQRFNVQFNYASTLVDGLLVAAPTVSMTLKESIEHISEQSKLKFIFVSESIISIGKRKSLLCGYLKDKDSGEPLPYVTVQNGNRGTIADEQGFFQLEVDNGNDVIEIRHIGHRPLRREARYFKTDACGTLYLLPDQQQLAEVVLYDYLIRGIDKLDDGSLQIDFNKFSILPGLIEKDVLHSVQALPGIQSIDESVSNINIRGGSNDQNLITWDGIKMYQSGHFFGLISMYNPHITQKVTLRKNGSGAEATDGVSGTIAMKTDENINPDLKGSIGLNLIDGNGHIDTPLSENSSIQIAARKSIGNFVQTPTYSEYFDRIKQDTELERNTTATRNSDIVFDFYDASLRLLFHPTDKDRLRVNFIHTANELTFNEMAILSGVEEIRQSNLQQQSIAGAIAYERDWSEKWDTEIAVHETDYLLRAVNANVLDNQRFLQENSVSETGLKLKVGNMVSPQLGWSHGYQFIETQVRNLDDVDDPRFVLLQAEVLRSHSLFTEMGLSSPNRKTQLNLGMRFNYLPKFDKQLWEPRLSFNHGFGQGYNVEVLGEFKHQGTSQVINFQNDFLGVEKRRWQLSDNDSVPIIRSKQVSLGLSRNREGWLVNIVPFYKTVDGITTQGQGFQDRYEFVRSSGSYDAHGIDFLVRKQLAQVNSWLSYSYLDSDYSFNRLPEPEFRNNYDITHAVSLGANYTLNRFLFAAGMNWRTGKPLTRPVPGDEVSDGQINFGEVNAHRQRDYLRLDLSGKYTFNWGGSTKAQAGIALWNLLNRDNTLNTFYQPNGNGRAQRFEQSSLGLMPNASFRLIFD